MVLVADSGSTKTDWVIIEKNNPDAIVFKTQGLNPNILSDDELNKIILHFSAEIAESKNISKIFFFGAGCSLVTNARRVHAALQSAFNNSAIQIHTDLEGAARAVCSSDEKAIVGILGTGSNSCLYNKGELSDGNFSLGYILGDEGSGSYFGKQLLRDHFYQLLPQDIENAFIKSYHSDRDNVISSVYRGSFPSEFLASFLPFIKENIQTAYCEQLIRNGFREYLKIYITRFQNYSDYITHFIGSAAWYFSDQLRAEATGLNIRIGQIVQSPIHLLAEKYFHEE